jgi:endonuclease/exonuclease/phosphatase (EEP) superfamily protein YafD
MRQLPALIALLLLPSCIGLGSLAEPVRGVSPGTELGSEFSLLCWNIHKEAAAIRELCKFSDAPDLVCLQEWDGPLSDMPIEVQSKSYWGEMGQAWRMPFGTATGVATFARTRPESALAQRSLRREGWIFTPKCSLLTCHALMGSQESLLLVNVHAMTLRGAAALREQMSILASHVRKHVGPVIVCGDFNTWRSDRVQAVRDAFSDLTEVAFPPGRTGGSVAVWLALGSTKLPLDRVFYRGLVLIGAGGEVLETAHSDHKGLRVCFRVPVE